MKKFKELYKSKPTAHHMLFGQEGLDEDQIRQTVNQYGINEEDLGALRDLNIRYCVTLWDRDIFVIDTYPDEWDRITFTPLRESAFLARHANEFITIVVGSRNGPVSKRVNIAKFWLKWTFRTSREKAIFAPFIEPWTHNPQYLNTFMGYNVEPKQGDWSRIRYHLKQIWCRGDEERFRYLMTWFAHLLQYPEEKPHVALVIKGRKGAGKSTIFEGIFGRILGSMYSKVDRSDQITGQFNTHHQRSLLITLEEAIWGGDKQSEGVLKSMITEYDTKVTPKGIDTFDSYSYYRLAFVPNELRSVPATWDERRYFALSVSSEHSLDTAYFKKLREEIAGEGTAAFMQFLLDWKVDMELLFSPPKTEALFEDIEAGFNGFERWVYHLLEDPDAGEIWGTTLPTATLYTQFGQWYTEEVKYNRYLARGHVDSQTKLTQEFKRLFDAIPKRTEKKRGLALPPIEQARASYEKHIRAVVKWSDFEVEKPRPEPDPDAVMVKETQELTDDFMDELIEMLDS